MELPSLLSTSYSSSESKEIGIIGAGAGGLVALKAVLDSPLYQAGSWKVTVFEAREDVGGVWLPGSSNDHQPPPTPLYDSLTTNLPHPLMAFNDYPFKASTPLFPRADAVQTYLRSYASQFNLLPHIRLNCSVTGVTWDQTSLKWTVETSQATTHSIDLLLICNGHHNIPRYPRIPGLQSWVAAGRGSHSIYYRRPSSAPFSLDQTHTVLVVGGGPSGQDIVADIANVVKKVIHSTSDSILGVEANVCRRGRTIKFLDHFQGVEFEGGTMERDIDFVLLATGYEVKFPFLQSSCTIPGQVYLKEGIPPAIPPLPRQTWNTSYGLFPLARYLFPFQSLSGDHATHPSLPSPTSIFFLGLLVRVVPMPLMEVQARAAIAAFANPDKVDWTGEAVGVIQRYEELKGTLNADGPEERIHSGWFRVKPLEQFDYRDGLVDFVKHLEGGVGTDGVDPERVRRVHGWEKELYLKKDVLRRTWRELEASGQAEDWVRGVGEGKLGRTAEEEWVELMFKVLRKGEGEGDREGEEEKSRL